MKIVRSVDAENKRCYYDKFALVHILVIQKWKRKSSDPFQILAICYQYSLGYFVKIVVESCGSFTFKC